MAIKGLGKKSNRFFGLIQITEAVIPIPILI